MSSYEHKKLVEEIARLDLPPETPEEFTTWLRAAGHLDLLRVNAKTDELIAFASSKHTFVNCVVVSRSNLSPVAPEDLMRWNFNAHISVASYVTGGPDGITRIERGLSWTGTQSLEGAIPLIFGRTFEGWKGIGRNYLELNQEYAHIQGIHWRPERHAYCRYNEHGDLEPVVSITNAEENEPEVSLATFKWGPLEEYLAGCDAALVRMFDFTLYRGTPAGWSSELPEDIHDSDQMFYHRRIEGHASYTRGVQIILPSRSAKDISSGSDNRSNSGGERYVEFIAHDWRNGRIVKISTDPRATTNYFDSPENSLPFEVSPAFFRPEVLSKYKTDRDKYTVSERDVSCRAAWHLRGIDVNEAGQVHAYICYLRNLPYNEQQHWQGYNEKPRTGISKRAIKTDFEGSFEYAESPLERVLRIVHRWRADKVNWWTLREEDLTDAVTIPLTESRNEWADAFLNLAQLVIEGFETKSIRSKLDESQIAYSNDDKTIALLERLLDKGETPENTDGLVGLRTVQRLRSKTKGHAWGGEATQLLSNALAEHETMANHFRYVCTQVATDLRRIESFFAP